MQKCLPSKKNTHIWFVVNRFIILSCKSTTWKKVFLMLLCNNDHYFWAFNAFLSVSYLYYCFASISFCMSVSLLCFNFPLKYERDLSNLWWRVFLLEKTRNSAILLLFKLCARNMSSFPKIKTIQTWRKNFTWLNIFPSEGMKCKLCVKWGKKYRFL